MTNTNNDVYALITGGSAGIGKALAKELAVRSHNLLLVALPEPCLNQWALELSQEYSIKIDTLGIDMGETGADTRIHQWITSKKYRVNILINNAGFGFHGSFTKYEPEYYQRLLNVNLMSVVGLSRLLIDELKSHEQSWLLNVGSIASFYPIPYKIVYAASKYFIYSFSRALREEMKPHNVNVSILCPGPIKTNNGVAEQLNNIGWMAKAAAVPVDHVAKVTINGIFKNKVMILPGFPAKLFYVLNKIVPPVFKQMLLSRKFRI